MTEDVNQRKPCIVVTGASSGIGTAVATQLQAAGATVVIVGRSPGRTREVGDQLGAAAHVADFADLTQVRELARTLLVTCPRIDVLVNNAGSPTCSGTAWPRRTDG